MPELPDITVYVESLERLVCGHPLAGVRMKSASLLRTVEPPVEAAIGRSVVSAERLGKRIALCFEGDLFWVIHLMIAGRRRWRPLDGRTSRRPAVPGRIGLAAFEFDCGTLLLTEAGSKKRASLHLVEGEAALAGHDPGGLEVLEADVAAFAGALTRRNHTLKRALTDPKLFSGIGNAYSDEILHRARLSPFLLTQKLSDEQIAALHQATVVTLRDWLHRLRAEVGDGFPEPRSVTAFREGFAVHGRFGRSCPDCGRAVQRIRYAESETNYCSRCQTEGRLLADRSLSRLLHDDWPRTIDELQ